ncbi:MAG: 16S rRNA (guanine(966)-N(2))-methyltransferase RsmD [Gammaproteobacteria bacterium]|nr:MAG: 16S rRNA (guanine(966)-N(2))-methyltransferase RsmD [Gammaproteobacteria bacterium]
MRRTGYQRGENRGSGAAKARGQSGRVRLIAGRFRNRRIPVADVPGLRPTPERTRETLFNWLQGHIKGWRVLDLFAGSGALGFEALSRGAERVVLIEQDRRAHRTLLEAAADLDPERCEVLRDDALRWPRKPVAPFDLVLIDPPFAGALASAALAHVLDAGLLAVAGRVYCEHAGRDPAPWAEPVAGSWQLLKQTRTGDSHGALLAVGPSATDAV